VGELVLRRPFGASASYGRHVPIEDVAARDIVAGDVVRLDDRQAQRVERAVHVDGRVVLELRPVGLEVSPDVLDGTIQPGRVFDRAVSLDEVPDGYRAMADREALKVLIAP